MKMNRAINGFAAALIGISAVTSICGCLDENAAEVSGDTLMAPGTIAHANPPSFAALEAALQPTEEQRALLAAAVATFELQLAGVRAQRGEARESSGHFPEGEPPLVAFLEHVVPALTPDQVEVLVEMLREHGPDRRRVPRGGEAVHGSLGTILDRLGAEIALSGKQREEIAALVSEKHDDVRALVRAFEEGGGSHENLLALGAALRGEIEGRVEAILSPEQFAQLQRLASEHRRATAQRRLERLANDVNRQIEFLTTVLALDPDQMESTRAIVATSLDARRDLLESIRDGAIEVEDALARGPAIDRETSEALGAALGPEQVRVFTALRRLLPKRGRGLI